MIPFKLTCTVEMVKSVIKIGINQTYVHQGQNRAPVRIKIQSIDREESGIGGIARLASTETASTASHSQLSA